MPYPDSTHQPRPRVQKKEGAFYRSVAALQFKPIEHRAHEKPFDIVENSGGDIYTIVASVKPGILQGLSRILRESLLKKITNALGDILTSKGMDIRGGDELTDGTVYMRVYIDSAPHHRWGTDKSEEITSLYSDQKKNHTAIKALLEPAHAANIEKAKVIVAALNRELAMYQPPSLQH